MLFGKNSDRQRNEAQAVEHYAGAEHAPDATLTCTYITIPQARRTHAVLLCRPFWMWGAEMGANEHGVVIGNEGLHARSPAPQEMALTGMDLLRLSLERATTAAEALDVMTALLERYGQGGNCGHLSPSYYNNGFIIADAAEAFVLETVGRDWLVERVRGVRALSNDYSIAKRAERTSAGMASLLRSFGWKDTTTPNYADLIADPCTAHIGSASGRRARAASLLASVEGHIQISEIMKILRDHDPTGQHEAEWDPKKVHKYSLCIHAGTEECASQTTGAMASEIRPGNSVHWVTGTAATCISVFKPVLIGIPLPAHGPAPTDRYDVRTLWWRHERLHRAALTGDFRSFLGAIRQERDTLEASFRVRVETVLRGGGAAECSRVVAACWREAVETESRWLDGIKKTISSNDTPYDYIWSKMNRLARMDGAVLGGESSETSS